MENNFGKEFVVLGKRVVQTITFILFQWKKRNVQKNGVCTQRFSFQFFWQLVELRSAPALRDSAPLRSTN